MLSKQPLLVSGLLGLLLLLIQCRNGQDMPEEQAVARVFDEYLYPSDLRSVIQNSRSPEDSIRLADDYIQNWIQRRLILKIAEKNLSGELEAIEQQAREYKESLIIYEYEQDWIAENLDTLVTAEEIETYYEQFERNFTLEEDIYRILFVATDIDAPNRDSLLYWLERIDDNRYALEKYCFQYSQDYYLEGDAWYSLDEIATMFALAPEDRPGELEVGGIYEYTSASKGYVLKVEEAKIKGEAAPLSYARPEITKIILNKRKLGLIRQTYQDIFSEGRKRRYFERFTE